MNQRSVTGISEIIVEKVVDSLHSILDAWQLMYYTGSRSHKREKLADFTPIELHIIKLIATNDNCMPLADIRQIVDMPNSSLSSIITRLARNSVLVKRSNPEDKRIFDLSLTDLGKKINRDHYELDMAIGKNFVSRVSKEDAEAFVRVAMAATRKSLVPKDLSMRKKEKESE